MNVSQPNEGHILLFHASPEEANTLKQLLVNQNYQVDLYSESARNVGDWSYEPTLILLDLSISLSTEHQSTLQLIRQLVMNSGITPIPVLLLLDGEDPDILNTLAAYQAIDFLIKPIQENDLIARIKYHLLVHRQKSGIQSKQATPQLATLQAIINNLEDAIVIANQNQEIIFCNAIANQLFQNHPEILLTGESGEPEAPTRLLTTSQQPLSSPSEQPLLRAIHGEYFSKLELCLESVTEPDEPPIKHWLLINGFPRLGSTGNLDGGIVVIRDITTQKQDEERNLLNSLQDELTGLPNRKILIDRIQHALNQAQREDIHSIALLFIDLDRFKAVNDTLGHRIGNELLKELAQRMKKCLRLGDTIARIGGDEFGVLLENLTSHSALITIVERLRQEISNPFNLQGQEVYIDASIGIAYASSDYVHPEDLLRDADIAMYRAKDCVDTHYQVFDSSMQLNTDNDLELEIALRKAISSHELVLHYQPIVLLRSQEVIGFEALVRWNHPTRGLLSPAQFITIAENTGLIIPLGWWVLKEACHQMRVWLNKYPRFQNLTMSVNMSTKQFSQKYVVETIDDILQETQLEGKSLKLEITESVLIEHSDSIIATLKRIQQLGIKLSIDDFGTGYSSLSYLHRFPFDSLKIDRSFVDGADTDYEKLEILQSVVHLAWNLGLEVVAEGVETEKNFAQLKALRCESGQGYLFSKPLDAQSAEELLNRQNALFENP